MGDCTKTAEGGNVMVRVDEISIGFNLVVAALLSGCFGRTLWFRPRTTWAEKSIAVIYFEITPTTEY